MAIDPNLIISATTSLGGLFGTAASAKAQEAAGAFQQASYAAQAQEDLRMAGIRADKAYEYAEIQANRKIFENQFTQINYKIAALSRMQDLRARNAAARARAAANGVVFSEGSALTGQITNVKNTMFDVGLIDLSALAARVFGMEDATNILKAGADTAFYERESAIANARAGLTAGGYARRSAGLMSGVQLAQGAIKFAETFPFEGIEKAIS
jgi:hypothetical protein